MNSRDDRVGIMVEERDDFFRARRVADAGVAAEIAEPQYGLDPLGHAAPDAALEDAAAGIAPR